MQKGKSILCMAAATIYMACKRCSVVRSLDEIVKAGGTLGYDNSSCKLASKYYRMMVMEMGIFGNQHQEMDQKRYTAKGRPSERSQRKRRRTNKPTSDLSHIGYRRISSIWITS